MSSVCVKRLWRAAGLALWLTLTACGEDPVPAEERVRALIGLMEDSVEAGSIRQAADLLHSRYTDPRHNGRAAAMRTLFGVTRRHRDIHLFTLVRSIELSPRQDAATAVVFVAMTGVAVDSLEALISLKADLYRFELGLVEEDGEWRILSSRWERVNPGSL
jgi:hypothetical protein